MVDDLAIQARDDGFQLNERKCKEFNWLSFAKNAPEFDPIWVNRQTLETVQPRSQGLSSYRPLE